jgi:hypothetical protein
MVSLFLKVSPDLVPRHQTAQHIDSPDQVPASLGIQLHLTSITWSQSRVVLFRLGDLGDRSNRSVEDAGKTIVGSRLHHLVQIERLAALQSTRHAATEFATEGESGLRGAELIGGGGRARRSRNRTAEV